MKATAFEFRFRILIIALLYGVGFWAPWRGLLHLGRRMTAWLWLSFQLSSTGLASLEHATQLITVIALLGAIVGAWLRVWGTAYLGGETVYAGAMQASQTVSSGPYTHMRNPLYWGSWLASLPIVILMPPDGALFTLVSYAVFSLRLIFGEEAFLLAKLGAPYQAYMKLVPRLLPSLWPRVAASGQRPTWWKAVLEESFPVSYALCFAFLAWRYNPRLLLQSLLVCLGVRIVVSALRPKRG